MILKSKPNSAIDPERHCRRQLFCILVVGTFLAGCATPAATRSVAGFTFDQYEVVTGTAQRQTVLTGFLLGGAIAELAMVNIDENDNRRLRHRCVPA